MIFAIATTPARWLSRFRSDVRSSLAIDLSRFSGRGASAFAALAAMAVAYPIAASIAHVVGPSTPGGPSLDLALRPAFDIVYSESLPFMIAVVGIGLFSPALGVLLLAVFIPADLWAASRSCCELSNTPVQPFGSAWVARLASYGLLWILAVEIPLRARGMAQSWSNRGDRVETWRLAAVQMGVTGVLVFLWAQALPFLIQPVFTWSGVQTPTVWSSDPTWYHSHILVIGAVVIAGVAAVWPRQGAISLAAAASPPLNVAAAKPLWRALAAQLLAVPVLVALLGGLLTTPVHAVILAAGLLVAGPVLTLLLPRIPIPEMVAGLPYSTRWLLAMGTVLVVGWVILTLAADVAFQTDYSVLVLSFAVLVPLFRFVLEAGRKAPLTGPTTSPPQPPPAVIAAIVVLAALLWLAMPATATADNCGAATSAELKVKDCYDRVKNTVLGWMAFAAASVGGFFAFAKGDPDTSKPPDFYFEDAKGNRTNWWKRRSPWDTVGPGAWWRGIKRALGSRKYDVKPPRGGGGGRA